MIHWKLSIKHSVEPRTYKQRNRHRVLKDLACIIAVLTLAYYACILGICLHSN